jgi:hypothetical protein
VNQTTLDAARQRAIAYSQLDTSSLTVQSIVNNTDSQSFLHFYSNWIIQRMDFAGETLQVNIRTDDIPSQLQFEDHVGIAFYQVNRMATAMASCSINGQSVLDLIQVQADVAVPGTGEILFPLRAFSSRPVYNGTYDPNDLLCGFYCTTLTRTLSISAEPCLDDNDQPVYCNNTAFGAVEPFVDLYYPPNPGPTGADGGDGEDGGDGDDGDDGDDSDEEDGAVGWSAQWGLLAILAINIFA